MINDNRKYINDLLKQFKFLNGFTSLLTIIKLNEI